MESRACVVILCGGSGVRLWPVSRPSRPKQFARLVGSQSLFVHTALRAIGAGGNRDLLVVAGAAHQSVITEQLAQVGQSGQLMIEPEGRDSGPAIAAAAALLAAQDPDAIMVVLASDHFIPDTEAFQRSLGVAEQAAREGYIVTLGIMPTAPSTAYGYIRPASTPVADHYVPVKEFREKPDAATAEQFLRDGYLWNSGNFVARAGTLLEAFRRFEPALAAACEAATNEAQRLGPVVRLGKSFHQANKISIDFAVMERADNVCVVPVNWAWSDLGAWDAVHASAPRDENGNALVGDVVALGARNSLIHAMPGMVVAASGIEDIAVVADKDAVLVCRLDASQSVKQIIDIFKQQGRPEVDLPEAIRPRPVSRIARDMRTWLFNHTLPLWWCLGADHANGGYREALAQDGSPAGESRRCRVQSRQAYAFALAGAAGWRGPWQQAVHHGFAALEKFYRRPDGLYRTLVDNNGAVLDDTPKLYDQAFILLALSAARLCMPDAEVRALALLDALEALKLPHGGYRANEPLDFQSNPHMHLFEASIAWSEIAGSNPRWKALAAEIAERVRTRFIIEADGALHEFFDENWNLAADADQNRIEPGHQFEWAWLLERWARLTGDAKARAAADTLFAAGRRGIDNLRGVVVNTMSADGKPMDASARLWPQTEWLKAANLFGKREVTFPGASAYDIAAAMRAFRSYFDVPLDGLWRDRLGADGQFMEEPAPASSLYHIVIAILDLTEGGKA